jgi:hypothetical protein
LAEFAKAFEGASIRPAAAFRAGEANGTKRKAFFDAVKRRLSLDGPLFQKWDIQNPRAFPSITERRELPMPCTGWWYCDPRGSNLLVRMSGQPKR